VVAVQIVMDWLGKLLNLPESFLAFNNEGKRGLGGGVIQVPVSPYLAHRLQAHVFLADWILPILHSFSARGNKHQDEARDVRNVAFSCGRALPVSRRWWHCWLHALASWPAGTWRTPAGL